jgi:hypothetical protein
VCVFITAVPIKKLFAWGGGGIVEDILLQSQNKSQSTGLLTERERERERERALLGTIHNRGLGRRPRTESASQRVPGSTRRLS